MKAVRSPPALHARTGSLRGGLGPGPPPAASPASVSPWHRPGGHGQAGGWRPCWGPGLGTRRGLRGGPDLGRAQGWAVQWVGPLPGAEGWPGAGAGAAGKPRPGAGQAAAPTPLPWVKLGRGVAEARWALRFCRRGAKAFGCSSSSSSTKSASGSLGPLLCPSRLPTPQNVSGSFGGAAPSGAQAQHGGIGAHSALHPHTPGTYAASHGAHLTHPPGPKGSLLELSRGALGCQGWSREGHVQGTRLPTAVPSARVRILVP